MKTILAFVLAWTAQNSPQSPPEPEYFCEPIEWTRDLAQDPTDDLYKGTIESRCNYKGLTGGGINSLEAYLHVKIRNEAKTIHAGPISRPFQGTPGVYYDVTTLFGDAATPTTVRQDIFFTNQEARDLFFSTRSKGVTSTLGIKQINTDTWIYLGNLPGWYNVRVISGFSIEKAWYVPEGMFKGRVKRGIEGSAPQTQINLMNELANHS